MRFIKNFLKIVKPLCNLLEMDAIFMFDKECLQVFEELKAKLISTPIVVSFDCSIPFELCVTSEYAIEAVLGQCLDMVFHIIYYSSKTLTKNLKNYTIIEKELLVVVYAFDKFRSI